MKVISTQKRGYTVRNTSGGKDPSTSFRMYGSKISKNVPVTEGK